jgi:pantoate--beta-alanine ligase
VATVVTKLLSVVRPDLAYFGEKDYQQLQVVRHIVRDLDLGVSVVGRPIVRDRDGLALSSRNVRLSESQRAAALAIPAALEAAAEALAWGEREARALERAMFGRFAGVDDLWLEYAVVVDAETLEPLETVDAPARALVAARIGDIHLIDNCALLPPTDPLPEGEQPVE